MSWLTDMAGGGVAAVIDSVGKAADALFTSDKERLDANLEAQRIGLQTYEVEAKLTQGQIDIAKIEAASPSMLVAGARPMALWVCVLGLAYQLLIFPLLLWAWSWFQARGWVPTGMIPPPPLNSETLMTLLTGMLGLSGARTYEKLKGVARDNMTATPTAPTAVSGSETQ